MGRRVVPQPLDAGGVSPRPESPLVTVVMIFRDEERFIREAIESVFSQAYQNWELILVDDGSIDGSTAIARQYAADYPDRVGYVEHERHANLGMSASRNVGLAHARGDFVALLDADDVYLPEKLAREVAQLQSHPDADVLYGGALYWYSWSGELADEERDAVRERGVAPGTLLRPPELLRRFVRGEARTPCTCGVLMRRDAVTRVGGFEPRFRGMFEDQAFFHKIAHETTVLVGEGCWAKYRQHAASACQVARSRGEWTPMGPSAAHGAFVTWLGAYLRERRVTEPDIWAAWHRHMFPYRHPRAYAALSFARRASNPRRVLRRLARELSARFGRPGAASAQPR